MSVTAPPDLLAIFFKRGVDWRGVKAFVWDALMACAEVCVARGVPCVVTSMTDDAPGRKPNSLHAKGLAFDLRVTHVVKVSDRTALRDAIAARLGADWDVLLHAVDPAAAQHIHVEYDPKPRPRR